MRPRTPHAALPLCLVIVVAAATAQELQPAQDRAIGSSGVGGQLGSPLEQGVEDADPLATSLRTMMVDLRDPAAFSQVYAMPGQDGMLMRADGGLFAVFPRSVYRNDGDALAPNDTVFHIGLSTLLGADWWMPESDPYATYEGRIDDRTLGASAWMPPVGRDPAVLDAPQQDGAMTRDLRAAMHAELGAGTRSALQAMAMSPVVAPDRVVELMRRAADAERRRTTQAARGPSSPSSK